MKKTTLWLAMVGALGLAGCGGGGGDSGGGGTTPPEPQPRALPDAGVYLPVLMDAQGQLINRPVNDSYRAVGFVYPATKQGTEWTMRVAETEQISASFTSGTSMALNGFSSLDKAAGYPLTFSLFAEQAEWNGNVAKTKDIIRRDGNSNVSEWIKQGPSLWQLDYQTIGYRNSNGETLFKGWGGQVALQPMPTAAIALGDWGDEEPTDLVGILTTTSNGPGVRLSVRLVEAGCTVTGETATNVAGLNKLMLSGWEQCTFDRPRQTGELLEHEWQTQMIEFAKTGGSVTAYLAMRPAAGSEKQTLLLGIPAIPGFVFEAEAH